ncbi:MAG: PP2C family protein-serine/threonine phosphatase [Candidatus Limisoma sp.]
MRVYSVAFSGVGKRRNNEDAFKIEYIFGNDGRLAVVCDGLGGHAMGEVASRTVADAVVEFWNAHASESDGEAKVADAVASAMAALDEKAASFNVSEMGTTMVMASVVGDTVTIAHVGDSRCYLLRRGEGLLYRTQDHVRRDFGWEVISRCFFSGHADKCAADVAQFKLKPGDRLLLCSDGLYKSMAPDILTARMMDRKPLDEILDVFDFMCQKFADDNYTGVLIEVGEH